MKGCLDCALRKVHVLKRYSSGSPVLQGRSRGAQVYSRGALRGARGYSVSTNKISKVLKQYSRGSHGVRQGAQGAFSEFASGRPLVMQAVLALYVSRGTPLRGHELAL